MVGDSDQSIYAFRGANIRNIIEFEQDFPNARTILLEQNYRSTQTILSAANAVIARNPDRRDKRLWSDQGDGEKVVGYVADNEHDEAAFVAEEIDRLVDSGRVPQLRRRRLLPDQLPVPGVRGRVPAGRAALQGRRRRAVLRAQGGPRRAGLPAGAVQPGGHGEPAPHPQRAQARHRGPGRGAGRRATPTGSGSRSPRRCGSPPSSRSGSRRWPPARSAASPRSCGSSTSCASWWSAARTRPRSWRRCTRRPATPPSWRPARTRRTASRLDNLAELVTVAREFAGDAAVADACAVDAGVRRRTRGRARARGVPERRGRWPRSWSGWRWSPTPTPSRTTTPGMVTLMTLHTAKGLEFPVVFLTGWEDGVFPHMRAMGDPTELAEERRLAYVGHHPRPAAALPVAGDRCAPRSGSPTPTRRRGSSPRCPTSWSTGARVGAGALGAGRPVRVRPPARRRHRPRRLERAGALRSPPTISLDVGRPGQPRQVRPGHGRSPPTAPACGPPSRSTSAARARCG